MQIDATSNSPHRTPIGNWLARGGVLCALVLLVFARTWDFGQVTIETQGDTTIYRPSSMVLWVMMYVLQGLGCIAGVVLWLARGVYRLMGALLIVAMVVMMGHSLYEGPGDHYVTVSPTMVISQYGSTRHPTREQLDLRQVMAMQVVQLTRDQRPYFELVAYTKPNGDQIQIRINDLMRKAMPEILAKAEKLGIPVADD